MLPKTGSWVCKVATLVAGMQNSFISSVKPKKTHAIKLA
jgi:hypothetical protein